MSSVAVHNNLSTFIDAVVAGDSQALTRTARDVLARAEDSSELIGQIGLLAMRGDSDGHAVLTLGAASALCRWLIALRHALGDESREQVVGVPLVVQSLMAAAPAVRAGKDAPRSDPQAIFPSDLKEGETVASRMQQAVYGRDALMVERLLFGLYGTGADYRTSSVRMYDAISQTFQEDGHSLLDAVRARTRVAVIIGQRFLGRTRRDIQTAAVLGLLVLETVLFEREGVAARARRRRFDLDQLRAVLEELLRVRHRQPLKLRKQRGWADVRFVQFLCDDDVLHAAGDYSGCRKGPQG